MGRLTCFAPFWRAGLHRRICRSATRNSSQVSQLPGYSLPLNYKPNGPTQFPSAFDDYPAMQLTTLREFAMMRLMDTITDKPQWQTKVFDEAITSKWKSETLCSGLDITERMFDYCLKELQHNTTLPALTAHGAVISYDGHVVKSDTVVSESLRQSLIAGVRPLEDVPDDLKDWHPGSDGKVLDLVHPSLFPVVYGRSRILPRSTLSLKDTLLRCGEGETLNAPEDNFGPEFSLKFQWMPCDVEFSQPTESDAVKITSYINNLHPTQHSKLYETIERVISCAIPLWNIALATGQSNRIKYDRCTYSPPPDEIPEDVRPVIDPEFNAFHRHLLLEEWYNENGTIIQPEPGEFSPSDIASASCVDLRAQYGDRGLQVIVKLANIHLTPDKPEYDGGTWHIEGQLNEHICASALYYYDSENITESSLSFRQTVHPESTVDISYPQDHHRWLEEVFGCKNDQGTVQEVGAVRTPQGRLVTFPNILHHRVGSFRLRDPTKPGHRKILALFLVDPNIRIISSANIPPQQAHWWPEEKLPDGVKPEYPIEMEEAKRLRLELMEERKIFTKKFEDILAFDYSFSLCEH